MEVSLEVMVSEVGEWGKPPAVPEVSVLIRGNIHLAKVIHLSRGDQRVQIKPTILANTAAVLMLIAEAKRENKPGKPLTPSLPSRDHQQITDAF